MDVTLTAETGRPTGSRSARRLRAEGKVPGVVYGLGQRPGGRHRRRGPSCAGPSPPRPGLNALITLDVDGQQRPHHRQGPPAPPGAPQRAARRLPARRPRRLDHRRGADRAHRRGQGGREQPGHRRAARCTAAHGHRQARRHPDRSSRSTSPTSTIGGAVTRRRPDPARRRHHRRRPRRADRHRQRHPRQRAGRRGRGRRGRRRRGRRSGEAAERPRPTAGEADAESVAPAPGVDRATAAAPRPTCWSSAWATPAPSTPARRHNVGFDVVDLLAQRHGGRLASRQGARPRRRGPHRRPAGGAGRAADLHERRRASRSAPLVRRYGIDDLDRLVIVHDELDLPLGRMKVKVGRRAGRPQRAAVDQGPPAHRRLRAGPHRRRQAADARSRAPTTC